MEQIKKILAPTDLSELSKVGVRYALQLAKAIGPEVTIYHAVDFDTLTRYGQRSTASPHFQPPNEHFLDRHQNALSEFLIDCVVPSVNVREKVDLGTADTSIVQLAQSEGYDLIVMSTHGKSGRRMSLGSVTQNILQTAPMSCSFYWCASATGAEMRGELNA